MSIRCYKRQIIKYSAAYILIILICNVVLAEVTEHAYTKFISLQYHMRFNHAGNILEIDHESDVTYSETDLNIKTKKNTLLSLNKALSTYTKLNWQPFSNILLEQKFAFFAFIQGEVYQSRAIRNTLSIEKISTPFYLFRVGVEWEGPFASFLESTVSLQPYAKLRTELPKPIRETDYQIRNVVYNSTNKVGVEAYPISNSEMLQWQDYVNNKNIYGGLLNIKIDNIKEITISLNKNYYIQKQYKKDAFISTRSLLPRYTSRLEARLFNWLNLAYHFHLSQKLSSLIYSEVGTSISFPIISLAGNYLTQYRVNLENINRDIIKRQRRTKQINLLMSPQITNNLSLLGSFTRELQKEAKKRNFFQYGIGACYNNDGFKLDLTIDYQYSPGMVKKPQPKFMITFSMNEGEYPQGFR